MLKAPRGGHHRRDLLLASALTALLLAAFASPALARDAYVTNGVNHVSVLDTQTNQVVGQPITVGGTPIDIAITPDGRFAYVANFESGGAPGSVSVIDTQTNQVVGQPITVGTGPREIAITPDGRFAYVANPNSSDVSVIDTQTNQVVGSPVKVCSASPSIAITPDGKRAYVACIGEKSVSVLDTQTNQVVGQPIPVGREPIGIAITPDGRFAYVANSEPGSNPGSVSVIDTQTNQVVGSPITVGRGPMGLAITPDGRFAYVGNFLSEDVSVIDTDTHFVGGPIPLGANVISIAITPDGKFAYATKSSSTDLSVIDTQTNQAGSPIPIGTDQEGVAIVPDQPPVASFSDPFSRPGVPVAFNASASSDPDGSIARYDWAFGDGAQALNGGPKPSHAYNKPGTYKATLTLTDNEGCSTALIFTGQTAYCNGSASASQTQTVKVAYPGVRLKCPKSAKPKGCKFKLKAVTKKKKGKVESAVAKAKTKAGKSAIVSLKPKKKFRSKLAVAKKILVKETVTIDGARRTSFRKLKIVQ